MANFKILKGYIKKGLVDILDRDGTHRQSFSGHSAGNDDGDKAIDGQSNLKRGQRPSDMHSFVQTDDIGDSLHTGSFKQKASGRAISS